MCGNFPSFKKFTAYSFSSRSNLWLLCLIQARQTNEPTDSFFLQLRGLPYFGWHTHKTKKHSNNTQCTFIGRVITVLLSSGIKCNLLLSSPHGKALMKQLLEINVLYLEAELICLEYTHFLVEKHNSCTNDSGQECVQNSNMRLGVTENLTVLRSRHASKYIQFWEGSCFLNVEPHLHGQSGFQTNQLWELLFHTLIHTGFVYRLTRVTLWHCQDRIDLRHWKSGCPSMIPLYRWRNSKKWHSKIAWLTLKSQWKSVERVLRHINHLYTFLIRRSASGRSPPPLPYDSEGRWWSMLSLVDLCGLPALAWCTCEPGTVFTPLLSGWEARDMSLGYSL